MRFSKVGDLEVVTRVTGPTHPSLGIAFSPTVCSEDPIVERVSLDHPQAEAEPFDPERDLCREVMTAVREANDRMGCHFCVTRIRYCADDPPIAGVYYRLAQDLIEHVMTLIGYESRGVLLRS